MDIQRIEQIVSILNFILRYFIASVISVAIPVLLWIIAYFVLFAVAIFANSDSGGLLALPVWAIVLMIVSAIYTTVLLFPSVLVAEIISPLFGKWKHAAQIPISAAILAILIYVASSLAHLLPDNDKEIFSTWIDHPWVIFLTLLIPLAIFWGTMKIVQVGASRSFAFLKKLRNG